MDLTSAKQMVREMGGEAPKEAIEVVLGSFIDDPSYGPILKRIASTAALTEDERATKELQMMAKAFEVVARYEE